VRRAAWVLGLLVACDAGPGHAPSTRRSSSASAVPAGSGSAAETTSASAPAPAASPVPAEPSKRPSKSALARGRELSRDGKWADAEAAFRTAAEEQPDNPIVYSELGWAAFNAGNLEAARSATVRGLEVASDKKQRASLLYNRGRIEEAAGKNDEAKASYQQSLALRPNDVVRKRLRSLGGKAQAAEPAPTEARLPCDRFFPTVRDACACLVEQRKALGLSGKAEATCAKVKVETDLATTPLEIVRIEAGDESVHVVLADVRGRLHPVSALEGELDSFRELAPLDGDATIASALYTRTTTDTGKTIRATVEILCLVGERKDAPRCPIEVTHAIVELTGDPPKPGRTVTFARTLKPDGTITVKKQAGPDDLVPTGATAQKKLF